MNTNLVPTRSSNLLYFITQYLHFRYGALDAKMASKYSFPGLNFTAVAGPTHDQHPPFSWSKTSIPDEKPTFLPIDTFDFEPFDHTWVMNGQEPK